MIFFTFYFVATLLQKHLKSQRVCCAQPNGKQLVRPVAQDVSWKEHLELNMIKRAKCSLAAAAKSLQSYPTLCYPIDGSPPGSPVPEILQGTLEWVAISFSSAGKWKVKRETEVAQSCPTLCGPMDCSPPGSSVHGIFQARVLEWGATAFSKSVPLFCWKYKVSNCFSWRTFYLWMKYVPCHISKQKCCSHQAITLQPCWLWALKELRLETIGLLASKPSVTAITP